MDERESTHPQSRHGIQSKQSAHAEDTATDSHTFARP